MMNFIVFVTIDEQIQIIIIQVEYLLLGKAILSGTRANKFCKEDVSLPSRRRRGSEARKCFEKS